MTGRRWVIVIVAALVLVGMIAYARGREHHRGDDVGALRVHTASTAVHVVTG